MPARRPGGREEALEWQALGVAGAPHARLHDGCVRRAFRHRQREMVELELHLAARALGMPLETPAVRP